ncbi:hypothetical protein GCM10009119_38530 [Algoriphagus jejuensis]|uniref:Glycosyltransferase 2-like domain-containing protein n=1 Tax=Algoriphagus jejuensis TaxID=419934 RepID=A0ABN1N4N1_9BACT
MDGGSDDNTFQIVKDLQNSGFKQIKWFQNSDLGVYDAMNRGLREAKGKWIYFLGSDDWLYENHTLESVSVALSNTHFNVAYGDVLIHGDSDWAKDQEIYAGEFDVFRMLKKNICHQSIFYKREFLNFHHIQFDLSYPINSDWDFNLKCCAKTKFIYLNKIIANFSSGGLSTNSKFKDSFFEEIPIKYKQLFPSKFRVFAWNLKNKILNI